MADRLPFLRFYMHRHMHYTHNPKEKTLVRICACYLRAAVNIALGLNEALLFLQPAMVTKTYCVR